VQVSNATLHRFAVEELAFDRRPPTILVADCGPGEEVQLDIGWVGWLHDEESGRRRRFRAWIVAAVLARHRFVYPASSQTTASTVEACEAAWGFFGGVFKVVISDNPTRRSSTTVTPSNAVQIWLTAIRLGRQAFERALQRTGPSSPPGPD
jgi:hypothetical protein